MEDQVGAQDWHDIQPFNSKNNASLDSVRLNDVKQDFRHGWILYFSCGASCSLKELYSLHRHIKHLFPSFKLASFPRALLHLSSETMVSREMAAEVLIKYTKSLFEMDPRVLQSHLVSDFFATHSKQTSSGSVEMEECEWMGVFLWGEQVPFGEEPKSRSSCSSSSLSSNDQELLVVMDGEAIVLHTSRPLLVQLKNKKDDSRGLFTCFEDAEGATVALESDEDVWYAVCQGVSSFFTLHQ